MCLYLALLILFYLWKIFKCLCLDKASFLDTLNTILSFPWKKIQPDSFTSKTVLMLFILFLSPCCFFCYKWRNSPALGFRVHSQLGKVITASPGVLPIHRWVQPGAGPGAKIRGGQNTPLSTHPHHLLGSSACYSHALGRAGVKSEARL